MKKNKYLRHVSDKTDSTLAGTFPTANSNEFVPKTVQNADFSASNSTGEIFDFIPELKTDNKYKN